MIEKNIGRDLYANIALLEMYVKQGKEFLGPTDFTHSLDPNMFTAGWYRQYYSNLLNATVKAALVLSYIPKEDLLGFLLMFDNRTGYLIQ